ncbi:MAG: hypothetical protein IKV81_07215 [Clostridia bacterium]|nr:hypothetical protein [Clostridia bacterium]
MKLTNAIIYTQGGNQIENLTFCRTEKVNNTTAIFIDAASQENIDSELGAAIRLFDEEIVRWVANWRRMEFWCDALFGTDLSEIPNDTQCLIYQKANGTYGVMMPVVSEQYKATLKGNANGGFDIRIYSWCEKLKTVKGFVAVYAEGDNPFELLTRCAKSAADLLGNGLKMREERKYPEVLKYLGWCSWDAFQIRVDEQSLVAKCQEFKDKQIPVKWAMIDDMWGEVHDFYDKTYDTREDMFKLMHSSKLYSFKADPKRFPNGLEGAIKKINDFGIKVGMWHPTTGYWSGIDEKGEIFEKYSDLLIKTENGMYLPSYEEEKAYKYYSVFHDYLKECGAEFVKIDNQSMTRRFYKKLNPVGDVARQFHNAMERSVNERFDNQMINCMGLASEDMWNRPISPVVRCSADFIPEDREWFSEHIVQCSYNTMVNGQFYYPDWDMWWTDDGQAVKNSLLRAISGGPIYVSDTLDRSRAEVLMPLCLSDGKILMCDKPAMPTADCLFENPVESKKPFKIQNLANGCGVLEAFNLDKENQTVCGTISPADIDGLVGEEFGVYEHFSKTLKILKPNEKIEIELADNDSYQLYIMVPLENGNGFIGNVDKFISPKTAEIIDGVLTPLEKGTYAFVENYKLVLKELECELLGGMV